MFPDKETHIQVSFEIDADGLVQVTATELTTGKEASVDLKPSGGLSRKQIDEISDRQ